MVSRGDMRGQTPSAVDCVRQRWYSLSMFRVDSLSRMTTFKEV